MRNPSRSRFHDPTQEQNLGSEGLAECTVARPERRANCRSRHGTQIDSDDANRSGDATDKADVATQNRYVSRDTGAWSNE
jgi:hypothetical protein